MTPEEIIIQQIKVNTTETAKQLLRAYIHDLKEQNRGTGMCMDCFMSNCMPGCTCACHKEADNE